MTAYRFHLACPVATCDGDVEPLAAGKPSATDVRAMARCRKCAAEIVIHVNVEVVTRNRPGPKPLGAVLGTEPWMDFAACKGLDPDLFHPPVEATADERRALEEAAKPVCASCPAVDGCLSYALRHGLQYGVWGGLSTDERRTRAVEISRASKHGTLWGYRRHRDAGEEPCVPCVEAMRAQSRRHRADQRARARAARQLAQAGAA